MNELECEVIGIQKEDQLCLIKLRHQGGIFGVMSLGDGFEPLQKVRIHFKESDVMLARTSQISARNKFLSPILSITHNSIMARVVLGFLNEKIYSLVSLEAIRELGLEEGMECFWFVKSNEIILRAL